MKKTVAITGSTGGIGKALSLELAKRGYNLIFINRSETKSKELVSFINSIYSDVKIDVVICDLADFESVKSACDKLEKMDFESLILNSGIYNVKVETLDMEYNNIFQVNFVSQYYMVNRLLNNKSLKKVIPVSSITYNYSKIDPNDIDFSRRKRNTIVYGNSKRFLMFSLMKLLENNDVKCVVAHPGVTLTNMTSHYPKLINWFIKFGIKVVFPSNKKAALNIVYALENETNYLEWIGPRIFNIWGKPSKKKLRTISDEEINLISSISQGIYNDLNKH